MYFPSLSGNTGSSNSPSAAIGSAPDASSNKKVEGDITGRFDPTALERGVAALKALDSSPNAGKAFEVIKIQEQTKQKEFAKDMEQAQTARQQALIQKAQVEGEEKRKTLSHQQEQERVTAQYKAQLEAEAYAKKLQDQQKQNEEWLRMQEAQFQRQEERRKQTELELEEIRRRRAQEQAEIDRQLQSARIQDETKGRILQERENSDVHIREMRAKASEERKTKLDQLNTVFSSVGNAFTSLIEDKPKLYTFLGASTLLACGIYGARSGMQMASNLIEKNLSKPSLIRETSRWTWKKGFGNIFSSFFRKKTGLQERIVLPGELSDRLEWTSNALLQAKKNGTPFRHLLLYGAPGTGKTLFARTLAYESGLDYAILSGGDVGPLGKFAVEEINKVFEWANKSRKGLILFIDESEAFLRHGRGSETSNMSEDMRNALSAFLYHTGTETDKFSIVLATNVKSALDKAVVDRVDESFEFPLPGKEERLKMLRMFLDEYFNTPTKKKKQISIDESIDDAYWNEVAEKTVGFSGRQISKLVISYQAAVFGSGASKLTKGMADIVLEWKLKDSSLYVHQ